MNHHVQYICRQLSDIHAVLDRTTAKCRAMLPKDAAFVAPYESCTIPKLPLELLDLVFRCLERQDLVNVVLTSSTFKPIGLRVLYHTIAVSDAVQSVCLLQTLVKNPTVAALVRSLELDWSQCIKNPTRNLYLLLQKALGNLSSLHSLTLDISRSSVWILENCPFSLRFFSTTFRCDNHLSAFLNQQPEITELCLRGVPDTPLGLFMLGEDEPNTETSFALLPTSLPKLAHLRAIHSGPRTINMMIQGRPVTGASIPLYYWNGKASLDALTTSTTDIKRLNLMSFDHDAPKWVLKEVAMRFPKLEALHVVVLLASCERTTLDEISADLSGFSSLQYLTFMGSMDQTEEGANASSSSDGGSGEEEDWEQTLATKWHRFCPSLRTIILPKGKVWFRDATSKSRWASVEGKEEEGGEERR